MSRNRAVAVLLAGLVLVLLLAAVLLRSLAGHASGERIGVGDVLTLAKEKRVVSATLRDEDALIVGEVRSGKGLLPKGGEFSAELPADGALTASLTALLAATGADVRVDSQAGKTRARVLLLGVVPVLLLVDLLALAMVLLGRRPAVGRPRAEGVGGVADLAEARALLERAEELLARHRASLDARVEALQAAPEPLADEGVVLLVPPASAPRPDDDEVAVKVIAPPATRGVGAASAPLTRAEPRAGTKAAARKAPAVTRAAVKKAATPKRAATPKAARPSKAQKATATKAKQPAAGKPAAPRTTAKKAAAPRGRR